MRLIVAVALALCMHAACAAKIYLTNVTQSSVQIIVDGTKVYTLEPGDVTPEGVRLVEIRGGTAVFQSGGRRIALTIGQSTIAETLLRASSSGQFLVTAYLNGVPLPSMIDTGATFISLNADHAQRLGIDFRSGRRVTTDTANGSVPAYVVTLARVQIGEVALINVPAAVVEGGQQQLPFVLIGMSFLKHVEMRRSGDTMSLSRPHLH